MGKRVCARFPAMGPPILCTLQVLWIVCTLLIPSLTSLGVGAASSPVCVARDRDALLAFKAGLDDQNNQLVSWTSSGNCCAFAGISCNPSGEVVDFTFEAVLEEGCDDCPVITSKSGTTNSVNLIGTTLRQLLALEVLNLTNFLLHDVTPDGLSALKSLRALSLQNLDLHGPLAADIGRITALQYLRISDGNRNISGPIPASFCELANLQTLILAETPFRNGAKSGAVPACIGQVKQLQVLDLEYNRFSGTIPAAIKQLSHLQELKVTDNKLSGSLPLINPGELPALELLYLEGNAFVGSIPKTFGNLGSLKELRIGGLNDGVDNLFTRINITGSIPATLGQLRKLQVLVIESTLVSGGIPASLAQLPLLTDLLISRNQLTGPIPFSLGATGVLVNLELNDNRLSGPIPASLGGAGKNLTTLFAARNSLTGIIPESLSLLQLGDLDLSFNQLSGPIPKDLGSAFSHFSPGQRRLYLNNNQLTGALNPPSLWDGVMEIVLSNNKLTSLGTGSIPDDNTGLGQFATIFDVHSNQLAGPIPDWIFQMRLADIDLSDNKLTKLPAFNGSRLFNGYINVSVNAITGQIPLGFTLMSNLNYLDLHRNQFTGQIPTGFGSGAQQFVAILNFAENQLTGPIPSDIFGNPNFEALILNKNKLSGRIPQTAPVSEQFSYLDLSDNLLTGPFPASVVSSPSLKKLKLSNNELTGTIPDFSSACPNLNSFVVENNQLTGPILPAGVDLTACNKLVVYDVSGNHLLGQIPTAITSFTALQVLDVSSNAVTGSVQTFLSDLHALRILDLSNNKLTGGLPLPALVSGFNALKVAGTASVYTPGAPLYIDGFFYTAASFFPEENLRSLQFFFSSTSALDLSGNGITGPIDASVGQLKGLHFLDLSHNRFSGPVPAAIAQIKDLDALDLSYNLLAGPIPSQLRAFPAPDFAGNPGLCGPPLANKCP